jgi:hypothetical protein
LRKTLAVFLLASAAATDAAAQRCDFSNVPGVVWWGTESRMTVARFASYMAPILWYSPDEPNLNEKSGPDIRVPEPLPSESAGTVRPVLYYQLNRALRSPGSNADVIARVEGHPDQSTLDLSHLALVFVKYFGYFATEEGLGAHPHDIEPAEFRVAIAPSTWDGFKRWIPGGPRCATTNYVIAVTRVSGQAHGLVWFWNVINTDEYTQFPMHLLVEEGKHAFATDKNGDGVFTKGFDVNVRINDAWGVRDIIRTGRVFSGGYESWMTKLRRPEHRVLPPLPDDSPLRRGMVRRHAAVRNAVYELRPFPSLAGAGGDHVLEHLMQDKVIDNWPTVEGLNDAASWGKAAAEGAVIKSLSIAYRNDGKSGLVWSFPFFVVKHLDEPMTGGYILQRMYVRGENLRDFGWTALYTPSASRWLDSYFSAGAENLHTTDSTGAIVGDWGFVAETGVKFRVNINETPLKALHVLTDYWGVRVGLKYRGAMNITGLAFVFEIGAGSF